MTRSVSRRPRLTVTRLEDRYLLAATNVLPSVLPAPSGVGQIARIAPQIPNAAVPGNGTTTKMVQVVQNSSASGAGIPTLSILVQPLGPDVRWDPPIGREPPPPVQSGPASPFNPNGPEPYRLWERGPDGNLYPLGQG